MSSKYPYLVVAKHRGWQITATTVYASDYPEALALGSMQLRRMLDQARDAGDPIPIKSVEVMLKSGGSMQAAK